MHLDLVSFTHYDDTSLCLFLRWVWGSFQDFVEWVLVHCRFPFTIVESEEKDSETSPSQVSEISKFIPVREITEPVSEKAVPEPAPEEAVSELFLHTHTIHQPEHIPVSSRARSSPKWGGGYMSLIKTTEADTPWLTELSAPPWLLYRWCRPRCILALPALPWLAITTPGCPPFSVGLLFGAFQEGEVMSRIGFVLS